MEGGGVELGGGAALHVHDFGAFVGDDEGALELAEVLGVDPEVGLEGVLDLDPGGDVDEAAAAEDGAIEGGEFVVAGGDDLAEPLAEDLVVLQPLGAADEDDALFADGGLDVGVGGLAIELGLDAGEELALLLGDAEALEGALDVVGDVVPAFLGLLALGEVVADLVELDGLEVLAGPVGGHGLVEEGLERLVAELADPIGVFLDVADVVDGLVGKADARVVGVVHLVMEVAGAAVEVERLGLVGGKGIEGGGHGR